MATCVILGVDGFDVDVARNLRSLYRKLGYSVVLARTPRPCDVLVIHRPPNAPVDTAAARSVHVFDYVGGPLEMFAENMSTKNNVHVFCSSEFRANEMATWSPHLNIDVLYPPVHVNNWIEPVSKVKWELVHIGNYKPSYADGSDEQGQLFLNQLVSTDTDVWGERWDGLPIRTHGRLKTAAVSRVYSQSRAALGMMYPFQRPRSMSGRYWHAPLNGCYLLVEFGAPTEVPGVGDKPLDFEESEQQRRARQAEAVSYWSAHYIAAARLVGPRLNPSSLSPQPRERARGLATRLRLSYQLHRR